MERIRKALDFQVRQVGNPEERILLHKHSAGVVETLVEPPYGCKSFPLSALP